MPDLPASARIPRAAATESNALVSELNLILVGPPGAGKGTQAERLTEDFNLPYFATGNILRAAVADGTELGRKAKQFMDAGELVPDEVIIGVIREALQRVGRKLTAVLLIDVSDDEVVRRLSGRRTCVKAGHTYHVELDPPKHDDVCDQDGSRLVQRDDDQPETIRRRLAVYHEQTEPLVSYYEEREL